MQIIEVHRIKPGQTAHVPDVVFDCSIAISACLCHISFPHVALSQSKDGLLLGFADQFNVAFSHSESLLSFLSVGTEVVLAHPLRKDNFPVLNVHASKAFFFL